MADLVAEPDTATTPAATPVYIPVLDNDTLDDDPVDISDLVGPPTIVTPPSSGTAVPQSDGTILYTPAPGFCGVVQFEYQIEVEEAPSLAFSLGGRPSFQLEACGSNPATLEALLPGYTWEDPVALWLLVGGLTYRLDYAAATHSYGASGTVPLACPADEGATIAIALSNTGPWSNVIFTCCQ